MQCLEDLEQPFGCLHCCRNWPFKYQKKMFIFLQRRRETHTNEVRLHTDPWLTKLSAAFALVKGNGLQLL